MTHGRVHHVGVRWQYRTARLKDQDPGPASWVSGRDECHYHRYYGPRPVFPSPDRSRAAVGPMCLIRTVTAEEGAGSNGLGGGRW